MFRMVMALVFLVAIGDAVGAPTERDTRLFRASYERPFGSVGTDRSSDFGAAWFTIVENDPHAGSVFSGHRAPRATDCWSRNLHFCIRSAYFDFAVPPRKEKVGWSTKVDMFAITLVSKQKIWFRGNEVDAITLKVLNTLQQIHNETLVVYNYDVGAIAFAFVSSDGIEPPAHGMPSILKDMNILASDNGIGGREHCRFWKCGAR